MGVQGLWTLVSPCARPIQLETLAGKRLAIDASIWLYQFQMAMRDKKSGETLQGAHIMGTFRRIMKLMFHGIKPVFVFDGDAPMLKKKTIEKRKKRKEGAGRDLAKTAQQLLAAQLRQVAAEKELNRGPRRKKKAVEAPTGDELDTGDVVDPNNAVYVEDLEAPNSIRAVTKAARKDVLRDDYALPSITGSLESRAKASDPRIATEEELREFIEELRPEDLDINSSFFGNLPTEVKYEILGDLRIKTRQVNHKRVQQMKDFGTSADFSRAQITNLMERNLYTQRLFDITDQMGQSQYAVPTRVAGQRNREYILIKQDVSKGGGWVLGVKNHEELMKQTGPITIDTTTDESVGGHTDTDEFDEVASPAKPSHPSAGLPTPDLEARRLLAVEAVRARYASSSSSRPVLDPYLDGPVASTSNGNGRKSLFGFEAEEGFDDEGEGEGAGEDEDAALQVALFESAREAEQQATGGGSANGGANGSGAGRSTGYVPPARPASLINRLPSFPVAAAGALAGGGGGRGGGDETDESMEYVDVSAASKPQTNGQDQETLLAPSLQQQQQPSSETDGSDAFEEVMLPAAPAYSRPPKDLPLPPPQSHPFAPLSRPSSARPSRAPSPAAASPRPSRPSSSRPPRAPSPPSRPFPPSSPPPAAPSHTALKSLPSRSIFDSILPSDSDSDHEREEDGSSPVRPSPVKLLRPQREMEMGRSETPDPFEAFEKKQKEEEEDVEGLKTTDFAFEEDEGMGLDRTTASPAKTSHHSPPPTSFARIVSPPTLAASASAASASLPVANGDASAKPPSRPHSPTYLPPPLPPLEKAQEAIEVEDEMEVLREDLAEDATTATFARRSPSPAPVEQAAEDEEPAADQVMYFEDLGKTAATVEQPPVEAAAIPGKTTDPEEEFFSDWSRSPSPPPRRRSGSSNELFRPADSDDDDEAEAAEAAANLAREDEGYAGMLAELRQERLEKVRSEATGEIERLQKRKNTELRNADEVTRTMAGDIKEMLGFFGIPFIDAPQEAEAECASLLTRSLVDGIVTDDSDVFLFGGSRIYRNMFNDGKYVECYLLADLEREIGLDRDKLVRLAYLLGSDYTEGLPGVGPVLGMELLDEFPGDGGLKRFKEWWSGVQKGREDIESLTGWRRKFKKSHKKLILDMRWPDPQVSDAYYRPTVQESDENFVWGTVDLDGLRNYLARTLRWDQPKSDSLLLPLITRENDRKSGKLKGQKQVTDFFDYSAGYQPFTKKKGPKYASKRLQNVVQNWKKKAQGEENKEKEEEEEDNGGKGEEDEAEQQQQPVQVAGKKKRKALPPPPKKAPPRKKSTAASRKRADKEQREARAAARGGVYSSDDEEEGAPPAAKKARMKAPAKGKGKGKEKAGEEAEGEEVEEMRKQPARKKNTVGKRVIAPPSTTEEDEE